MERDPEEVGVGSHSVEFEHGHSRITHNALENIGALGQGFKQLFNHQRRRSSVSPHDIGPALSTVSTGSPAPEPFQAGLEAGDALLLPDTVSQPAVLSRVLQQVMKQGASLQTRRHPTSEIHRVGPQPRPRSASATDTACSAALLENPMASACLSAQDYNWQLEVSGLAMGLVPLDGVCATDGVANPSDPQRSRQGFAQLQQKVLRLTEQIRVEQAARDDNVAEYLKLANNADRLQSTRIKQVFEKKNQKSAQTVLQLQKKLDLYQRKLREAEQGGSVRQHKDVHQSLRGVGSKVTTKPKEFASAVHNRFGSSENVWVVKELQEEPPAGPGEEAQSSPRYGSEDEGSSATSGSMGARSTSGGPALENPPSSGLEALLHQLQDVGRTQARLEEALDKLRGLYERDYQLLMQALQDQRYRCERLEEQLNDLMELHQNEVLNLKQDLASVEEKIAYQSYERGRDVQEALDACQTRICKMELQQQQGGQMEGGEGRAGRPLLGKLINVLLALMAVLLVCVSAAANCAVPLLKTRARALCSLLLLLLLAFLWKNWDTLAEHLDHHLDHLLELYA
ncbi:transmembrane and coiled-coil domains protein 1-like isoform X1 [Anguilla rostrata]